MQAQRHDLNLQFALVQDQLTGPYDAHGKFCLPLVPASGPHRVVAYIEESDGARQIVGFADLLGCSSQLHLDQLQVSPHFREQGVGSGLMDFIITQFLSPASVFKALLWASADLASDQFYDGYFARRENAGEMMGFSLDKNEFIYTLNRQ